MVSVNTIPSLGNGSTIGGNYYSNPTGTGFSETCGDTDTDGICDLAFNLTNEVACTPGVNCSINATDYLVLSNKYAVAANCGETLTVSTTSAESFVDDLIL